MPAEQSVREQTKSFFGNLLKRKPKDSKPADKTKDSAENKVEELERSLTKDDPLLESNTFNGEEEDDERKNSKNKRREEEVSGLTDENNKENISTEASCSNSVDTVIAGNSTHRKVQWSSDVTVHEPSDTDVQLLQSNTSIYSNRASILKTSKNSQYRLSQPLSTSDIGPNGQALPSVDTVDSIENTEDTLILDESLNESFTGTVSKALKELKRKLSKSTESLSSLGSTDSAKSYAKRLFGKISGKLSSLNPSFTKSITSSTDDIEDKTLHVDELDSGGFETLWRASSKVIKKLQDEQSDLEFGETSNSERNKRSVEEPEDLDKDDKKSEKIEELPVVSPPKKKKWKGFRFPGYKKGGESPEVKADEVPLEEIQTLKEETPTSELEEDKDGIVEVREEKEEPEEEEGPSTSRVAEEAEEPDEARVELETPVPVPKPRRQLDSSISKVENEGDEVEETVPRPTRRRRRRKGPRKPRPDSEQNESTTLFEESEAGPSTSVIQESMDVVEEEHALAEDDGMVLGVTVHHSDHLRADLKSMAHPVVRVSVVNGSTGSYLEKTASSRRVTSYYENETITSVLPIMTQPYDFRSNQSVLPRWEETLIFNESFQSMVALKNICLPSTGTDVDSAPVELNMRAPCPMVFFVIRDFISMAKANNVRSGRDDVDQGWHTIAWAFLKLVGSNGKPNTGHRVRLQLFHPPRNLATLPSDVPGQSEPAFFWWRDHLRQTYPSTLYVTLKSVNRPGEMDPACRSMFATQPECGIQTYKQLHQSLEFADGSKRNADEEQPKWSRLPGQTCKVPNAVSLRLWSGSDGAFTVRFSNGGRRLAVACKHGTGFPILLYGIPSGDEMGVLNGHQQLVYDIQWSNNDEKVVSSSADGTAQVWDMNDKSKATHTLPHPAYVYTAAFHPSAQYIVATGGYDSVIRVWSISTTTAQMLQELEGHKSFVNSLAFDFTGLNMYSVDSSGLIIAWNCHSHEKPKKTNKTSWSLKTKYIERELTGVCINNIQIHSGNNKLLLHCRDSVIRMFDVRIHTLLRYNGSVNHRQFVRSALTPCGSFVVSGSEDGCAYVWNADSGDQVAIYNELGFSRPVRDVSFHPHDHLVAFCCFAPNMPVLVFKYNKDATSTGGMINVVGSSAKDIPDNDLERSDAQRLETTHGGVKVDRIKRQLDSVLSEPEPSEHDKWFLARKMIPLTMAAKAFVDVKNSEGSTSAKASPRRPMSPLTPRSQYLNPQRYSPYGSYGPNNTLSTWGSTFDTTNQGTLIEPSYMSPHASPEARVMAQHIAAGQPKPEEAQGWRPTFASVGGSPYRSDLNSSLGPDVSFTIDEDGNRSLRVTSTPGTKPQHMVIALYDYQANRSDELTMARGDVIKVLYKDGATWWFGERLSDEKQGYFPSNYVAMQGEETDDLIRAENSPEVLFGVPSYRPESAESEPSKTVHALKMASGRVQFYSHSESEGDEERQAALSISSRQRRREKRGDNSTTTTSTNPTPVPRGRTTSFKTPISSKPPRQRSPRADQSSAPRKLPTFSSPTNVQPTEETNASLTENNDTAVETTPTVKSVRPKKSKSKDRSKVNRIKRDDITSVVDASDSINHDDTSVVAEPPDEENQPELVSTRQHFGVLKEIQARMAENDQFSKTVLGGPEFSGNSRGSRLSQLAPIMTSTATKTKKSRSRANRSSSRGRTPKVLITEPSQDDDAIPMLDLGGEASEVGVSNLAYDDTSEL